MASEILSYVDSSALAKLVVEETETPVLRRYLRDRRVVSSELAIVELARVERMAEPARAPRAAARGVLAEVSLASLSRELLERAAELTSRRVRSLDAVQLATALTVEADELVAYDRRLLDAATAAGLTVASPGA